MMAGADGDALLVQRLADVLDADFIEHERDRPSAFPRRADKRQSGHGAEAFKRIFQKPMLVGGDIGHADPLEIIDRRAKPDRIGDGAGAGLEFLRRVLEHVFSKVTSLIMLPPPCHGGMASSILGLAVEHADAGRAEHLVAGEHVEIGVERLHVDRHVAHGLGAVDQHARAVAVRHLDHVARWRDRAERIGDMGEGDDACLRIEQLLVLVEQDIAAIVDRSDTQLGALLASHSICHGTMLAWCSRLVTTISSPSLTLRPPQALATRLIASVVPRTQTMLRRKAR